MKTCIICDKLLVGHQSKFCSTKCKNSSTNNKHQNYVAQQARGKERRHKLIKLKGGRCQVCGYKKNQAALTFHHLDPTTKSFQIDIRVCSNRKWESLLAEVSKCSLLCLVCHAEVHYPDLALT